MQKQYIATLILIPVLLLGGCRATRVTQEVPALPPVEPVIIQDTIVTPVGELRGYYLNPESWMGSDREISLRNLAALMEKIAGSYYNTLFFSTRPDDDALQFAVGEAHRLGLRLYAGIEPRMLEGAGAGTSSPLTRTEIIEYARRIVERYNIDGLFFRYPEFPTDLIEKIAVETMLVKPYLILSVITAAPDDFTNARGDHSNPFVDLVLADSELAFSDPDCLPPIYTNKVSLPERLKKIVPEQVVSLDLSALFPADRNAQSITLPQLNRTIITDSDGKIRFVNTVHDTLEIIAGDSLLLLPTESWAIPYRYSVMPDGETVREAPWVEFRRMPPLLTGNPVFDLLCKTDYPSVATINGVKVKQYKTGIFFNRVVLNEGPNRIRATVITPDSLTAFYEGEYIYKPVDISRKPLPLWIDGRSVVPAHDLELLQDDIVRVSFQGSLGQNGFIELEGTDLILKCSRTDFSDYSLYATDIPLKMVREAGYYSIIMKLRAEGAESQKEEYELPGRFNIVVKELHEFPLVKVIAPNSRLIYNLGPVRLGGPIRSEFDQGVVMKSNGKIGEYYRIRLSNVETGIIHQSEVETLPEETVAPSYFITSLSCGPSGNADMITIPYLEPVPYEVQAEPEQNRIVITLFGVETSNTWVSHRTGLKMVDKITWKQTTPETYQVFVNLKRSDIWGYDVRVDGKRLIVRIKYPPVYDITKSKPLSGLKFAIEAGHGGTNYGAIGLSGLKEKDINLDLSFRLGELLSKMGAEVIQVRDSDRDMTLIEKRNIAIESRADILLSIHANAGGTGYLQVAGTSTYWHNPFWAPLAQTIYDRLLEMQLAEFGVVGAFNYTGIRLTQMPSILVEQAFMSHAEDEEKMADPEFRQLMAEKIYLGVIDYLKYMKRQ
jgi:N-acetylmuramoyl-L-alanine amidase